MDIQKFLTYLEYMDEEPSDIRYKKVEGGQNFGGKSFNTWIQVATSHIPLNMLREDWKHGKRSCVWTAYDDIIYDHSISDENYAKEVEIVKELNHAYNTAKNLSGKELTEFNRRMWHLTKNHSIPETVSGTFKSCTSKYSFILENLGMKMAMAMDLPTSFNYITEFDKYSHPEITGTYENPGFIDKVLPYGLVSIDFLKNDEKLVECKDLGIDENEARVSVWLPRLEERAREYLKGLSEEEIERQIKKVKSRLVRSVLLREYLGDVDFTAKNCGIVLGHKKYSDGVTRPVVRFAPNYDYGEICRNVVMNKFESGGFTEADLTAEELKTIEIIRKFKPQYSVADYLANKKKTMDKSVKECANEYAVEGTSQDNLQYIFEHFPEDVEEFYSRLHYLPSYHVPQLILRDYCTMIDNEGKQLLTRDEASIIAEYLNERVNFMYNRLPKKYARLRPTELSEQKV